MATNSPTFDLYQSQSTTRHWEDSLQYNYYPPADHSWLYTYQSDVEPGEGNFPVDVFTTPFFLDPGKARDFNVQAPLTSPSKDFSATSTSFSPPAQPEFHVHPVSVFAEGFAELEPNATIPSKATRLRKRPASFLCPHCKHRADRRCDLNKHIKRKHKPGGHACTAPGCEKTFHWPKDLKRHVTSIHVEPLSVPSDEHITEMPVPLVSDPWLDAACVDFGFTGDSTVVESLHMDAHYLDFTHGEHIDHRWADDPAAWHKHIPRDLRIHVPDLDSILRDASASRSASLENLSLDTRIAEVSDLPVTQYMQDAAELGYHRTIASLQHGNKARANLDEISKPLDTPSRQISAPVKPGTRDETLVCSVTHANFGSDDLPVYEAFSYVWGNATLHGQVLLDGSGMGVRYDLAAALRRMGLIDATPVLWMDALCIDQKSDEGRSRRVSLTLELCSSGSYTAFYADVGGKWGLASSRQPVLEWTTAIDSLWNLFACLYLVPWLFSRRARSALLTASLPRDRIAQRNKDGSLIVLLFGSLCVRRRSSSPRRQITNGAKQALTPNTISPNSTLPIRTAKQEHKSSTTVALKQAVCKMLYHRPQNPELPCGQCKMTFRGDHELRRHSKRAHASTERVWICLQPAVSKDWPRRNFGFAGHASTKSNTTCTIPPRPISAELASTFASATVMIRASWCSAWARWRRTWSRDKLWHGGRQNLADWLLCRRPSKSKDVFLLLLSDLRIGVWRSTVIIGCQ